MLIKKYEMITEIAEGLTGDFMPYYNQQEGEIYLKVTNDAYNKFMSLGHRLFASEPVGYRIAGQISAYISFPEVEKIISKYYQKYDIHYTQYTCKKLSCRFEEMFGSANEYRISNPGDTKKIIDKIQIMVDDLMPFFERFKTLEDVYEYLESDELENKTSFINSQGFVTRRLIMRALFKADNFHELGIKYTEFLKKKSGEPNYKYEALYMPELYEELCAIYDSV